MVKIFQFCQNWGVICFYNPVIKVCKEVFYMSMMVNRVSNVSFRSGSAPVSDDFLSRPGAYAKPQESSAAQPASAPKKKHSVLKAIAGVVVAAAVVAGGLYAAHKYGSKTFDAAKEFAEFKELDFIPKWKGYITTAIGKAGKAIEDAGNSVVAKCGEWWAKAFPKKAAAPDSPDMTVPIEEA